MSANRVLALSMRPKLLEDCIGQGELVSHIDTQLATGRIPHFFIIHGAVGAGKTTLARIIALTMQIGRKVTKEDWQSYSKFDIQEINAANRNGIDDIRSIVEHMRFQPIFMSKAKVVIMDEAHQLTTAAQNALITETEDVSKHAFYIFCTSALNKIIPALQRRAYIISPKPLLDIDTLSLLRKAASFTGFENDVTPLHDALRMSSITAPGLILQAAEKFFSGIPANESVYNNESCSLDTMAVCRAVSVGSWKDVAYLLKPANKADITMIKNCVMGYLRTILLNSSGNKALVTAKAIRNISDDNRSDCLPTFLANLCVACEHIKSAK